MEQTQKSPLIRWGILGGLVLVAVVLLNAPKRSTPVAGPTGLSRPPAPAQKTLPELVQERREQILEETTPQPEKPQAPQAVAPPILLTPVPYTAEHLRDPLISLLPKEPTAPPATAEQPTAQAPPEPPHVTIQGMIWGGARPQVLIDGELYEVGETVQGATIVAIDREGVTVEVQGTTFRLTPSSNLETPALRTPGYPTNVSARGFGTQGP